MLVRVLVVLMRRTVLRRVITEGCDDAKAAERVSYQR